MREAAEGVQPMAGRIVRDLLRRTTAATLATLDVDTGFPYASLVEVASTPDAHALLLLSGLARHTRNLLADSRASLLLDRRASPDGPLVAERATLVGRAVPDPSPDVLRRYLARYPSAEAYAGLGDFRIWRLDASHAHLIAGFGRISEVPAAGIVMSGAAVEFVTRQEREIQCNVNARDEVRAAACRVVAIDPEGVDVIGVRGLGRVPIGQSPCIIEKFANTIACAVAAAS